MADMKFENRGLDDEYEYRPVDENIMSTDTVFDPKRVDETNALTLFKVRPQAQAHAEREAASDELMELAQSNTSLLSNAPRAVNTGLLREEELIDKKDKFINKYMQKNNLKLRDENRNELYSNLNIDEYGHIYFDNDLKLTMENYEPYSQVQLRNQVLLISKKYFRAAAGETPMIGAGRALMQPVNLDPKFRKAQSSPENIELDTIAENEPETGFSETSFSKPELRKRSLNYLSAEPTMADQQRIFEAIRDVDIVEFVQEPRGENAEIDIQLKNANKLQFKLKEAKANLKTAEEHKNEDWIHDVKKEIESIELHLKTIAGKLARLYADKFYDSSLTWRTRLRYLFKLKGFKIGVIVSAIGITFSAIVVGLIETFTPIVATVKKAGDVVVKVAATTAVKKAGDVIVPVVNSAYQQVWKVVDWAVEGVKKIIGYIGAGIVWVVKNIMGYMFEYIIILIAVALLVMIQTIYKNTKTKKLTK